VDEGQVKAARSFGVEIRQVVVADLDRVDRCVTCHVGVDDPRMTDVPQPFTTHPGEYLADHEIDKFGCTACHLGQGRSTDSREAHAVEGEVFWEQPMLPAPLTQASCGTCHDPQRLARRGAPVLAAGLEAFRTEGCLGCHKLGGRGGVLGPALDRAGDKSKHSYSFAHVEGEKQVWTWHQEHLKAPQDVVPDSKMPATQLGDEGIDALTAYLLSLRETNLTEQMTPRDRYEQRYRIWHTPPLSGSEIYRQFCYACHEEGTETVFHDALDVTIPSVRHPDLLAVVSKDFLVENLRMGRPGTQMPAWGEEGGGLTEQELERVAEYLLEARQEIREITFEPSAEPDPVNGKRLFEEQCTDCHALTRDEGDAPWLGSAGFQQTYSDALIAHTIIFGREDTLMIGYGEEGDGDLANHEISDLVSFIRTMR
jgi:mono/diheme cytochrome c family protein